MSLRNFWIEGEIDGRETPLAGGPRGPGGGFTMTVKMRRNGFSYDAISIEGKAHEDGTLVLLVKEPLGLGRPERRLAAIRFPR